MVICKWQFLRCLKRYWRRLTKGFRGLKLSNRLSASNLRHLRHLRHPFNP